MENLTMPAHKNTLLNQHQNAIAPSAVSYLRRLVSRRTTNWTPAYADVTARGGDRTKTNHGFSLVELSIVLVILGLLVGGVLTGKSLIRAAELRSVTTEFAAYQAAIQIFKEKYQAIPGDMTNATMFWGAEPIANCPGDETTPSTTSATCNGDGNGQIWWASSGAGKGEESHRLWQHLANAGLITGTYTGTHNVGTCDGGSCEVKLGLNAPFSRLGQAGWSVGNKNPVDLVANRQHHSLFFFGAIPGGSWTQAPVLTPTEAWGIDKKIDDAQPGRGIVGTFTQTYQAGCASSDTADSEYEINVDNISCSLIFFGII
jgi:prepilin-type N-terminal cleavage/methylation domain-containing protein